MAAWDRVIWIVLDSVGICQNQKILDAGCGEGYLARKLALSGARVTGVDMTEKLIDAAKEFTIIEGPPVTFLRGSVNSLPFKDNHFDTIICNHLLNDLEEPQIAIREFSRVLKPGARVVILMLHPCFYSPRTTRNTLCPVTTEEYFQTRSKKLQFLVDGVASPVPATIWLRPLEYYVRVLVSAGFLITEIKEPHPTETQFREDPQWLTRFTRPLFMLLTAKLP